MDVEEFMNQLDADKFSKMEWRESVFDNHDKCRFIGETRDGISYNVAAKTWEQLLSSLPGNLKVRVF